MKKPIVRRVLAFIVDAIIVSIIASSISSIKFLNPDIDKYNEAYDSYVEYINNGLGTSNTANIMNSEEYQEIAYNLSYYGKYSSLISLIISILYYIGFQYITKGYTGGKKLLRIKVEAEKGKLKIQNIILRSLVINGIATSTLSLIIAFCFKKDLFFKTQTFVELLSMGLIFVSFAMMLTREDGKGLHDLIAKTKVVYDK